MAFKVAVITYDSEREGSAGATVCAALAEAGHEAVALEPSCGLAGELAALRCDACVAAFDEGAEPLEAGALQGLLEVMGLPFVGSGSAACRRAAHVADLADVLQEAVRLGTLDARVPRTLWLASGTGERLGAGEALGCAVEQLPGGYPVEVANGRGEAPRTVNDANELADAVRELGAAGLGAVVREWSEGVEVAVGVLGDLDDLQVLPPVEIVRGERVVLDEASGLGDTQTDYFAPVRLDSLDADLSQAQAIRSELERAAVDAYLACGCRDMAVVSLVWDGARACVRGIDAAPAWGGTDVLPLACEAADIPLAEALGTLVEIAVERGGC